MTNENGKFCPRCNQPPGQVGRGDGCLDPYCAMSEPQMFADLKAMAMALPKNVLARCVEDQQIKIAAATAHRVCCGVEHDPANGKLHGYCVVCGVPWPCETAKNFLFPASAQAAAKVQQWQPIETAPKDGTEIILSREARVTSGLWFDMGGDDEGAEGWSGWVSQDGGFSEEHPPTNWMPLPEPPTEAIREEKEGK